MNRKKQWMIQTKKANFQKMAEVLHISPVMARILRNRGLTTQEELENYLHGTWKDIPSGLLLPDAIKFMNRLLPYLKEGKKIRIIGDYDVDGVCATTILYRGFRRLGANVDYVIPDRRKDGYGLNEHLVKRAKEEGTDCIVTCDNGISAREEIRLGKRLGMEMLVTDHHDIPQDPVSGEEMLPEGDAVVNPKRKGSRYPYPNICGAVVAWKLVELLYQNQGIAEEEWLDLLPFAAIATVCDVMPLLSENRIIVKEGIPAIMSSKNLGLRALLALTGLRERGVDVYAIGFILGPCINAGGRLESAEIAMRLFLAGDPGTAEKYALELKELNESRKDMTGDACEAAYCMVEEHCRGKEVLALYLPGLHESLCGIVAGRVRERYYRPTFVLTDAAPMEDGTEVLKGSGRSIEGYSMAEKLGEIQELLLKFGGHPMAAGFSLKKSDFPAWEEALNKKADIAPKDLIEKLWIDVPLPIGLVSESLVSEMDLLKPFGNANCPPMFAEKDVLIREIRIFGKQRNVVKLLLQGEGGSSVEAVLFTDGDQFTREKGMSQRMHILYSPEFNDYNGKRTIQLRIRDYNFA